MKPPESSARSRVDLPPVVLSRWQRFWRWFDRWSGSISFTLVAVAAMACFLLGELDRAQVLLLMLIVSQLTELTRRLRSRFVVTVKKDDR